MPHHLTDLVLRQQRDTVVLEHQLACARQAMATMSSMMRIGGNPMPEKT